jgi:hypothetical protein
MRHMSAAMVGCRCLRFRGTRCTEYGDRVTAIRAKALGQPARRSLSASGRWLSCNEISRAEVDSSVQ